MTVLLFRYYIIYIIFEKTIGSFKKIDFFLFFLFSPCKYGKIWEIRQIWESLNEGGCINIYPIIETIFLVGLFINSEKHLHHRD